MIEYAEERATAYRFCSKDYLVIALINKKTVITFAFLYEETVLAMIFPQNPKTGACMNAMIVPKICLVPPCEIHIGTTTHEQLTKRGASFPIIHPVEIWGRTKLLLFVS